MKKTENRSIILVLISAIGVVGANSLVLSPIAGDVASSFAGATATDVMLAAAVYGAGTALSALVFAPRADLMGLGRSLSIALSVLGGALCLSAAAPMVSVLIAAQGIAGIAAGVALPAIYGLSAEVSEPGRESETLGKVLTGWTLSLVLGVTFAAILSDLVHWRAVFGFLAAAAVLLLALLTSSGHASRPARGGASHPSPLKALGISGLPPLLVLVSAYMVAFYGLYAFLGTHLTLGLGLSTMFAGLSALSYGFGFGAVAPLDRLIDRHGASAVAPFVFGALTLAYIGMAVVSGSGVLVITLCALWGAINHLGLNLLVGALTALDPNRRGTILGLYSAVTYASMFIGTTIYKSVFELHGFTRIALLSAFCILPATVYALARRRSR